MLITISLRFFENKTTENDLASGLMRFCDFPMHRLNSLHRALPIILRKLKIEDRQAPTSNFQKIVLYLQ